MNPSGEFPRTIRAEVKFTQSESISVPPRELRALSTTDTETVGIVAALFCCGDESLDGEWLLADATDSVVSRSPSIRASQLRRVCRNQTSLGALRERVDQHWKPFFAAYFDLAKSDYRTLRKELRSRLDSGTLGQPLPKDAVLRCDYRAALDELLSLQGPSGAGRSLQALFAYLLGFLGYRTININPIGVPDVEASNLLRNEGDCNLRVSRETLARLVRCCREAGDTDLAAWLRSHYGSNA